MKYRWSPVDRLCRSRSRSPHMSLCYRSSSPLSMCGLQEEEDLHTTLVSATLQQLSSHNPWCTIILSTISIKQCCKYLQYILIIIGCNFLTSQFLPSIAQQQSPATFSQPRSLHSLVPSSDSQQHTDSLTL